MNFAEKLANERFADDGWFAINADEFRIVTADTFVNNMRFKFAVAFVHEQDDLRSVSEVHFNDANVK